MILIIVTDSETITISFVNNIITINKFRLLDIYSEKQLYIIMSLKWVWSVVRDRKWGWSGSGCLRRFVHGDALLV